MVLDISDLFYLFPHNVLFGWWYFYVSATDRLEWTVVLICVLFQKNQAGQQPVVFKPHPEHMPGMHCSMMTA